MRLAFVLLLLFASASQALAADTGGALYARHCAACHGEDGRGGVGVPLALPAFLDSVSDRYLDATIRIGRPGRVMPAFPELTETEIGAIIAHLRGWSKGTPVADDPTPVAGDAARGAQLFAERCANCHGADGKGGHGTGVTFSRPRDLPIIAPALNNAGFLAAASDQFIRTTLRNGRAGTPMLSFLEQGMSERDIDDVVSYVRSYADAIDKTNRQQADSEPLAPVLRYESAYDFTETVANVKRAAEGRNFRLIRDQAIEEGFVDKGKEAPGQMMVYFCNFQFLYDALAIDPRVGLFLPCRVTVLERDGKVEVMAINPKRLSVLFNNDELNRACDEMFKLYRDILEEATL